jgi:hypothetical protein
MSVKKITKEVIVNKAFSKKVLNKIATTSKDDWKKYYKNLSQSVNSLVHNIDQRKIFIVI